MVSITSSISRAYSASRTLENVEAADGVAAGRLFAALSGLIVGYQLILAVPDPLVQSALFAVFLISVAFAAPALSRALQLPISVLLILLMLAGHIFLGNISHGPFSIRIYAPVVLGIWMLYERARHGTPLLSSKIVLAPLGVLILLLIWRAISMAQQSSSLERILDMSMPLAFAALSFMLIQRFIRTRQHVTAVVLWLLFGLLISAGLAVLQWLGFELAWSAATQLRPGQEWLVRGWGNPDIVGEYRFAPGLSLYSIPLGYLIATFGAFGLAWAFTNLDRSSNVWVWASVVAVLISALLIVQSRSAVIAVAASWTLALYVNRGAVIATIRDWKRLKYLLSTVTMSAVLLAGIFFAALDLEANSSRLVDSPGRSTELSSGYSLARFLSPFDSVRSETMSLSARVTLENPVFGVSPETFDNRQFKEFPENERPVAPHNLFLNASVYSGIPGFLIVTALLVVMAWIVETGRRAAMGNRELSWIGTGIVVGFVGFFLNAQFHNDGLFNDGTLLWWLAGLGVALISVCKRRAGPESEAEGAGQPSNGA